MKEQEEEERERERECISYTGCRRRRRRRRRRSHTPKVITMTWLLFIKCKRITYKERGNMICV